jgi:phage internal scaffolding protein
MRRCGKMKMVIRTVYGDYPVCKQAAGDEPSRTQQQFAEEADINNIIARYERTGILVDPLIDRRGQPMYGDFSNIDSYFEAQLKVAQAKQLFEALPAKIRDRFGGDAGKLLAFVEDPENREEAIELGLIEKPEINNDVVKIETPEGVSTVVT